MRQPLFWEGLILGALLLYLSRTYTMALYMFLPLYLFLVYHILHSEDRILLKLTALSVLTATSLSLRFDYFVWGDPWADYAVNRGILESRLFPLTNEEPLARFLTVSASMFTGIDLMTVQKFLIPALGSLAVPMLYVFMRELMPERGALYSGLLLTAATPYLHWVTQGVRESLGLFVVLLVLYLSYRAIKEPSRGNILLALAGTTILPVTHPRAALIFFAAWVGFSFFYLVHDFSRKKALYAALIFMFALVFSLRWWMLTNSRGLVAINKFLSNYSGSLPGWVLILCVGLILLYFSAALFRSQFETWLTEKKRTIYSSGLAAVSIALAYTVFFFSRKLALPYPAPYFFSSIVILSLGVAGIYCLLEKDRTPILGWMLGLSLLTVSNLLLNYGSTVVYGTSPAGDLMRPFVHLSLPLAAAAGMGFLFVEKKSGPQGSKLVFASIVLVSLITSFPSIAFLGKTFAEGSLAYDERSWLISHTDREIAGVEWLKEYHLPPDVVTDRYVRYPLMHTGLNITEDRELSGSGYIFVTERMLHMTDFGEMFYSKRKGLDAQKFTELDKTTDKLYSNSYADIYLR